MPFLYLSEAACLLDADYYGEDVLLPQNFYVDSRNVTLGAVFVALKGERTDGHTYISQALAQGAAVVVCDREKMDCNLLDTEASGASFIFVKDTEKALVRLAEIWLKRVHPEIIGITGSVGKTTTREILASLIRGFRPMHVAIKSYNTLIGCSLTVLAMPKTTQILLLEFGTNHLNEIAEMVSHFPPKYAVITEVATAHLEGLGSLEGVLAAKMEIVSAKGIAYVAYNFDNIPLREAVQKKSHQVKCITEGVGKSGADLTILSASQAFSKTDGAVLDMHFSYRERVFCTESPLYGKQHAYNVGYAYLIAKQIGMQDDAIVEALSALCLPSGRGGIVASDSETFYLDDTYNSNPCSLSAAVDNLKNLQLQDGYRRIAIISGMRELGVASERIHRETLLSITGFDAIFLVGKEWDNARIAVSPVIARTRTVQEMLPIWQSYDKGRSFVLLKGSRYYEMEKILPQNQGGSL